MPLIPNTAVLQRIATLPLATCQAGETVLAAGTKTGRLLILRKGVVTIEKEGTMIAKQKEKWMELCELAANEKDANKLLALITEINRLLEVKQQRLDTSNPGSKG